MSEHDSATDDLSGCQSTNHDHSTCYGALWQCSECKRMMCCNEGTDDGTDLCDDCFAKKEGLIP
jgi:hypothetical protein